MKLILASNSPRRREILSALGLRVEVLSPDVDEDCDRAAFTPEELVMGLACRKVRAAGQQLKNAGYDREDCLVLSADTVVALDGQILEKPRDDDDARRMLCALSGRMHEVYTGIALLSGGRLAVDVQRTAVYFRTLTKEDIETYIATGEPRDKAGSYGIQGRGGLFVERIDGDYFNVVGLPVVRVDELARSAFGVSLMKGLQV